MATHVIRFSDAAIRRFAKKTEVSQLRDARYNLRFRYGKDRSSGSWHIYKCMRGKELWRKIGNWPALTATHVLRILPDKEAELSRDIEAAVVGAGFDSVGALLLWFRDRALRDRNLSPSRRRVIKWAIDKHLIPRIGRWALNELNPESLDEHLLWSMQETYAVGSVRAVWGVLRQAFRKAIKLKLIKSDPVAVMKFADSIEASSTPKLTEIQAYQLPEILQSSLDVERPAQMLVVWMLLHGTRIGETRQARWSHIDFEQAEWNIPACHTKTRQAHNLPITPLAFQVLRSYRSWQNEQGYEGVYLFPNASGRNSINSNKANSLIQKLSCGEWRSHSLRKITRTTWLKLDVDYVIGELLLNHALSAVDQAYIQTFADDKKRESLIKWHAWLDQRSHFFLSALGAETLPRSNGQPVKLRGRQLKGITPDASI